MGVRLCWMLWSARHCWCAGRTIKGASFWFSPMGATTGAAIGRSPVLEPAACFEKRNPPLFPSIFNKIPVRNISRLGINGHFQP
jgi:hypothetical protein